MARISVSRIKIFWPRTHWINAVKADDCISTTIKIDEPTVWIGLADFLLISAPLAHFLYAVQAADSC